MPPWLVGLLIFVVIVVWARIVEYVMRKDKEDAKVAWANEMRAMGAVF